MSFCIKPGIIRNIVLDEVFLNSISLTFCSYAKKKKSPIECECLCMSFIHRECKHLSITVHSHLLQKMKNGLNGFLLNSKRKAMTLPFKVRCVKVNGLGSLMVIGNVVPPSNFDSVTAASSAFPSEQMPPVTKWPSDVNSFTLAGHSRIQADFQNCLFFILSSGA